MCSRKTKQARTDNPSRFREFSRQRTRTSFEEGRILAWREASVHSQERPYTMGRVVKFAPALDAKVASERSPETTFTSKKLDLMNAVGFDHERIDPYAFRVFHALMFCLNEDDGLCCPSDDYLVMLAGGSRTAVWRARNKLRQCGYVDWRRRRGLDGKTHCFYAFYHTAAAPVLASVRRQRERRKERHETLRREAHEAFSYKPFETAPF